MITNNHIINKEILNNDKIIKLLLNDSKENKTLEIKDRKIYTSKKYDTTIIEINSEKDKIKNFLEIDQEIFDKNINMFNKSIYILQYHRNIDEQKAAVSYGILKNIEDKYNIIHYCYTDQSSSGSPILNISNKRIIGIHSCIVKNNEQYYNRGILLKYPINEYLNDIKIEQNNEIRMELKIRKKDVNKSIYFLDNTDGQYYINGNKSINHHHDNLKELNESNVELFINNIKQKYTKYFKPLNEGIYKIRLQIYGNIKDISFMFFNCPNIESIDLSSFDTSSVTNMSYLFSECTELTNIDLSLFDTKNVTNMGSMFFNCSKLTNIDLSNFNTKNVSNMSFMFFKCNSLTNIDLSSFNTENVKNISGMFYRCSNLEEIDLNSFNTKNVTNMNSMFYNCSGLKNLNLTSFNTQNVTNMSYLFYGCSNLSFLNLFYFDTRNVNNMNSMFSRCTNLIKINLSSFNTKNVIYMSEMFICCKKLS